MARKSFSPGNNNAAPNQNQAPVAANGIKMPSQKEFLILVISAVVGIGIYFLGFSILRAQGINFFFSSILGFGFGLLALLYIDSVFKTDSEMAKPIIILMSILLLGSLAIHYLPDYGKKSPDKPNTESNGKSSINSKTLTITGTEEQSSQIALLSGERYKVRVSGSNVYLVNGNSLIELTEDHGPYVFQIDSDGYPGFKGSGGESQVTIDWR